MCSSYPLSPLKQPASGGRAPHKILRSSVAHTFPALEEDDDGDEELVDQKMSFSSEHSSNFTDENDDSYSSNFSDEDDNDDPSNFSDENDNDDARIEKRKSCTNNDVESSNFNGNKKLVDKRMSCTNNNDDVKRKQQSSNFMATIALCSCFVSLMYLLSNLFPYSGYMCIQLVDGLTLENAGSYAGILVSSFMFGRFPSSYFWGKIADTYGRRFVLVFSLINSAFFSIAFGLSTNFAMAITTRFLLGLGNGLSQIVRTSVTELARGDREKESRAVGLVMSMIGYGMLLGPAIGGALSNPLKQYPESVWFGGQFDHILLKYPFILPNIIGCLFCLIALLLVILFVDETLPDDKRRGVEHIFPDMMWWIINSFAALGKALQNIFSRNSITSSIETRKDSSADSDIKEETSSLLRVGSRQSSYNSVQDRNSSSMIPANGDQEYEVEQHDSKNQAIIGSSMEQTSKRSYMATYRTSLYGNSTALIRVNLDQEDEVEQHDTTKQATIGSFMQQKSTRSYLVSYWINSFAQMCFNETFPLFAMSADGGLSMKESAIGSVGTFSGLLFCLLQYTIYKQMVNRFGAKKTMRLSSFMCIISIVTPVSLLLPDDSGGWVRIFFLSVVSANGTIMHTVFIACTTIGINGTVEDSHRATVNGLASAGVSIARGSGPIFVGALVAVAMTGMVIPAQYGSLLVYSVLGAIGFVAYGSTMYLTED